MAIGSFSFTSGGGGGGGGGLRGAAPRDYNPASGGVPGVTSPIDTISGNLGGINDIINSITSSQNAALRSQYPNEYFSVLGQLLGNTQRRAGGDISDLLPQLQQNAAERAVAGGVSGSGAANSKLLRDIGLTRYDVENQALRDLSTIQGEIPTVRPYDPSGVIAGQLEAQGRADMYAAAPNPEAAYQRAMQAANSGSGAPGKKWNSGGVTYRGGGGGGGAGAPTYTGWNTPPIIAPQRGTAMNPFGGPIGMAPAPYGSIDYSFGNLPGSYWGQEDDFSDVLAALDEPTFGGGMDFGGSLGYGGGSAWQPFGDLGFGGGDFSLSSGDSFMSSDYGPTDYGPENYDDFFDYYT